MFTDTSCINGRIYLTWYEVTGTRNMSMHCNLCQALDETTNELRGVVVCKLETHRSGTFRGYVAMLAVQEKYRGRGIASKLVRLAIDAMKEQNADEVTLRPSHNCQCFR